jgi:hypothetical protein
MISMPRTKTELQTDGLIMLPDGTQIKTIECPDLDNKPFVSCIPEGIYRVRRDYTGKHTFYKLLDVPGRSFIEIHPASKVEQLEGCIGMSRKDCELLIHWFGDNDWILEIT